jgi:hypothetical protein
MSSQTISPSHGATATGVGTIPHPNHRLGDTVRAVRVFVTTAFNVAVLGEYAEEAGVRRRHVPSPRSGD